MQLNWFRLVFDKKGSSEILCDDLCGLRKKLALSLEPLKKWRKGQILLLPYDNAIVSLQLLKPYESRLIGHPTR